MHSLLLGPILAAAGFASPAPQLQQPFVQPDPSAATWHVPIFASPIVQMFQWTFDSVAAECGYFLGPAGVGYVQVGPAQDHWNGQGPWYDSYQPVGYNIAGKLGNRTSFENMVKTCHDNGVRVIVDTVMNHCAGELSGKSFSGVSFTKYNYPGTYQYQDFHHSQCGSSDGTIQNYNNATEVQFCELVGLADLATETEYVRSRLAEYINDLVSLGVDGLRLDAVKHMPAADIANILSRVDRPLYITQEFIYGQGEPITPDAYVGNGDVQEFRFTSGLQSAFSQRNIAWLGNINNIGWLSASNANTFVANHDTERGGGSLNYLSPNNAYVLAYVFALSFPYGTPTILSGYQFSTSDQGAPNGGFGTCYGGGGVNGWLCQHRWTPIAGMIGFYNQVYGRDVNNWVSDDNSHIAYGRGTAGYVAINAGPSSWIRSFATSLSDGVYCDVVTGSEVGGSCTGRSVNVTGGAFNIEVYYNNAVAIHIGAKIT